jgi:hypothetical protein
MFADASHAATVERRWIWLLRPNTPVLAWQAGGGVIAATTGGTTVH